MLQQSLTTGKLPPAPTPSSDPGHCEVNPTVMPLGTTNELGIMKPRSGLSPYFATQFWVVKKLLFVIFCWVRILTQLLSASCIVSGELACEGSPIKKAQLCACFSR